MEAAVRLAARKGISDTRVSDIVGKVGVGQGVFYWYFESKESLFREILTDTGARLRRFQGGFIAEEPDPVRRVALGILATLDFIAHNRHVFALLDHDSVRSLRERDRGPETERPHVVDTRKHLEAAIAQGLARASDPDVLAVGVAGVVDRMARSFLFGSDGGVDAVAQDAIDFCLGGVMGARALDVADLRRDLVMTPRLTELRDRVGAGLPVPTDG